MKEVKKLFSKLNTGVKTFFNKVKSIFKSINKPIKSGIKKISNIYRKANSKNKYVEPIVIIGTSCLLVLLLILSIRNFTIGEEVNITRNAAEYLYYGNEFDKAVKEYKKMQEEDEWPIWTAKIADIYSLQGEVEKSNTLLREVLIKRDKIIRAEGYEKYKEKDLELIRSMLFTFTLNKEYGDVISFAEQYITDHGNNKDIIKILFTAYIQNNNEYKAKKLIDTYPLDKKSAYDMSTLANMNILVNRWDEGIELLNEAWTINSNELKIYNVVNDIYLYDKDTLISKLENKIKETDEYSYKMFLARAYANDKSILYKALRLTDEFEKNGIDNIGTDIIKYNIYVTAKNKELPDYYLDKAVIKAKAIDKNSYSTYYLLSLKNLNSKNYDEALVNAKKSINSDKNNYDSFSELIPNILSSKKDFKSIEVYYRTAMSKEPYNYNIIMKLADYYLNYASDNNKVREYYEFAIKIRKSDSTLYKKIVDLDIKEEKYEDAIKNIKEAIRIDDKQEYYTTLGALYLTEGKNEEGIENIRKAYSMNEKDVRALNNAAYYYLTIEKDLLRGFENLKAAYSEVPIGLDEEDRKTIIENYAIMKKAYDKFMEDDTKEFNITGLKLIY